MQLYGPQIWGWWTYDNNSGSRSPVRQQLGQYIREFSMVVGPLFQELHKFRRFWKYSRRGAVKPRSRAPRRYSGTKPAYLEYLAGRCLCRDEWKSRENWAIGVAAAIGQICVFKWFRFPKDLGRGEVRKMSSNFLLHLCKLRKSETHVTLEREAWTSMKNSWT